MKRRDFLVQTGTFSVLAMSGGLRMVNAAMAGPEALASPDAVLSIDASGQVVFISPFPEMGQGSPTAASMIIADELDTNLDTLQLRDHDGLVGLEDDSYGQRFNGGGSGGSQSMATGWPALREIGATARTSLIEAAALTWSVPAAECETATDCVQHTPSGRRLSYAELVATAAGRPVPQKLRYRPVADYRYVGKPRVRADMDQILTGRATYAMDYHVPGMLYASIERCPSINGKPLEYDRTAALGVPGVLDVFTLNPREVEASAKNSIVVVAKDTWSAMQGRRKLRVQWEDAEKLYSDETEFWSAMETQLDSDSANGEHTVGDFEGVNLEGLSASRQTYRTGYQNQTMM